MALFKHRYFLSPCSPVLAILVVILYGSAALAQNFPIRLEIKRDLDSRLANIHLQCDSRVEGKHDDCSNDFVVTYGPCGSEHVKEDAHHLVGDIHNFREVKQGSEQRIVWLFPQDIQSGGCLSAWSKPDHSSAGSLRSKSKLLGRSPKLSITKYHRHWQKTKRDSSIPMTNASGIDTEGPWMDGVELLKNKEIKMVDVKKAKAKKIAIIGAGMSGLMTWLCLKSSGFHNLEIIEAGERLGGRVHTEYLQGGPFDYQYQEMGPMRFPESVQYAGHENETLPINDHKLVFQLAQKMNSLNDFAYNYSVDFIPWIQNSPNGLLYFNGIKKKNGMPPTITEVQNHPRKFTIQRPDNKRLDAIESAYDKIASKPNVLADAAANVFKAHKKFLDDGLGGLGGGQWSEFAYLHNYLKFSLNITDMFLSTRGGGILTTGDTAGNSFWDEIYDNEVFGAVNWRTIDGGLNRLPNSFYPHVGNITRMSRHVSSLEYHPAAEKVTVTWRDSLLSRHYHNDTYNYVVAAVPFSILRGWRFPNTLFNPTKVNAINNMPYLSACKVALQFETRFWEHYDKPIIGSCSTISDIPGIGSICYPSYNLHAPGPAVMLASYIPGDFAVSLTSLTEEEHVQYVLDAAAEIHGDVVRQQYTGRHARRCWIQDPLQRAGWAAPLSYMHELYIPEYFKTENNVIFVGEHTSFTQAWIASALESGIRGAVQLMLELGLVDEAKATTSEWMARWISV